MFGIVAVCKDVCEYLMLTAGILYMSVSECMHIANESEGDDEEEQETGDGML